MSATLYDFRDLDLLLRLNEDGGMTTKGMSEALGVDTAGAVGSRLAWMKRYGMVDLDSEAGFWNVSPAGRRVVQAKLKARDLAVVEKLPDEAMVEVMAQVTSRYQRGEATLAHLLRREFMYGTGRRR